MFQNNLLMAAGAAPAGVTSAFTAHEGISPSVGSHTFTDVALGDAAAGRIIIVGLSTNDYGNTYVSGTVEGEDLTEVVTSGVGNHTLFLLQASESDSTTGDIFVDWHSTSTMTYIGVWALYGANSTVSDTASAKDGNPTVGADIDCPAGGAIVGICRMGSSGSPTGTWENLTEDFDAVQDAIGVTGAHDNFAEEQSGLTISVTQSTQYENRICLASYGPAE